MESTTAVEIVPREMQKEPALTLAWAENLTITTPADHQEASIVLLGIKELRNNINKAFKPHLDRAKETKRAAEETRKGINDERVAMIEKLQDAEQIANRVIVAWETEQERIRREEAEQIAAVQRRVDEDARLALAEAAKEAGADDVTTDAILETPVIEPTVIIPPTPAPVKTEGLRSVTRWSAEIEEPRTCAKALIERGLWPSEDILRVIQPIANRAAKAMKEGANAIPGMRVVKEVSKERTGR